MMEFDFLACQPAVIGQPIRVADVVMGAYDESVVRVIEE